MGVPVEDPVVEPVQLAVAVMDAVEEAVAVSVGVPVPVRVLVGVWLPVLLDVRDCEGEDVPERGEVEAVCVDAAVCVCVVLRVGVPLGVIDAVGVVVRVPDPVGVYDGQVILTGHATAS